MYSNLYVVKCPKFDHLITPLVWSSGQMGGGRLDQKISVCFIHRNWLRYRLVSSVLPRCYGFRDHGTAGERRTCRGGLGVDARWFVPCRSQENTHAKNANKLDGEIDIPICAICVWFHNHPYSEFAGQSHVYLFLMFPMTMPS